MPVALAEQHRQQHVVVELHLDMGVAVALGRFPSRPVGGHAQNRSGATAAAAGSGTPSSTVATAPAMLLRPHATSRTGTVRPIKRAGAAAWTLCMCGVRP